MAAKKKTKTKRTGAKKAPARKAPAKKSAARPATSKKSRAVTKPAKKAPAKKASKRATARPSASSRLGTSTAESMRALAQKILAVSASGDDDAILALYAPNVESIEMGQPAMTGVDALRLKFHGWREMVSDAKFTPLNVWVDGNTIVVEWRGVCTMAGSGKRTELDEIAVHEIENGKIVRERYYYDPSALQP